MPAPPFPSAPPWGRGSGEGHGRHCFCCEARRTGPKVFHDLSSISPIYAPKGFTKSGFFCASVQNKPIPCLRDSLFASSLGLGYSTETSDPARRPSAGAMPGRCGFCLRGETHRPNYFFTTEAQRTQRRQIRRFFSVFSVPLWLVLESRAERLDPRYANFLL